MANKGRKQSSNEIQKKRLTMLKLYSNPDYRNKQIAIIRKSQFGKKRTIETRKLQSIKIKESWLRPGSRSSRTNSNHWNWQGGIAKNPYNSSFKSIRNLIRLRDNFQCQLCGIGEEDLSRQLAIHHIDFDKQNCVEENLIALCNSCNVKVNYNRENLTNYLKIRSYILSNQKFFEIIGVELEE